MSKLEGALDKAALLLSTEDEGELSRQLAWGAQTLKYLNAQNMRLGRENARLGLRTQRQREALSILSNNVTRLSRENSGLIEQVARLQSETRQLRILLASMKL